MYVYGAPNRYTQYVGFSTCFCKEVGSHGIYVYYTYVHICILYTYIHVCICICICQNAAQTVGWGFDVISQGSGFHGISVYLHVDDIYVTCICVCICSPKSLHTKGVGFSTCLRKEVGFAVYHICIYVYSMHTCRYLYNMHICMRMEPQIATHKVRWLFDVLPQGGGLERYLYTWYAHMYIEWIYLFMYVYMCICILCTWIYKSAAQKVCIYICVYTHVYMYIYAHE